MGGVCIGSVPIVLAEVEWVVALLVACWPELAELLEKVKKQGVLVWLGRGL